MSKMAFVYPGQGCQAPGMGKDIYENYESARKVFDRASKTLKKDLEELCFAGSMEELSLTENTQPAILTVSIAMTEVLKSHGIMPDAVAGLSLGEYSALVASGAMTLEEAVSLVRTRGLLMQNEVPQGKGGLLAVVGLSPEKVEEAISPLKDHGTISCSNFNAMDQTVVGGELVLLDEAQALLKEAGARMTKLLNVSAPFHTNMLKGAGQKLRPYLEETNIQKPLADYYPNTMGKKVDLSVTDEGAKTPIIDLLEQQVSSPVRWVESVKAMIEDGVDTFVEVYPGKTVASLIKKIDKNVRVVTLSSLEDLEAFIAEQKGETKWAV